MAQIHGFLSGELSLFQHLESRERRCYNHLHVIACGCNDLTFVEVNSINVTDLSPVGMCESEEDVKTFAFSGML